MIINLETVKNWLSLPGTGLSKVTDEYYKEFQTYAPQSTPYTCAFYIRDKNKNYHVEYFDNPDTYLDLLIPILKNPKSISINLTVIALTVLERLIDKGYLEKSR